jgi:hypothetical protein
MKQLPSYLKPVKENYYEQIGSSSLKDLDDLVDLLIGHISNTIDRTSMISAEKDYRKWNTMEPFLYKSF